MKRAAQLVLGAGLAVVATEAALRGWEALQAWAVPNKALRLPTADQIGAEGTSAVGLAAPYRPGPFTAPAGGEAMTSSEHYAELVDAMLEAGRRPRINPHDHRMAWVEILNRRDVETHGDDPDLKWLPMMDSERAVLIAMGMEDNGRCPWLCPGTVDGKHAPSLVFPNVCTVCNQSVKP